MAVSARQSPRANERRQGVVIRKPRGPTKGQARDKRPGPTRGWVACESVPQRVGGCGPRHAIRASVNTGITERMDGTGFANSPLAVAVDLAVCSPPLGKVSAKARSEEGLAEAMWVNWTTVRAADSGGSGTLCGGGSHSHELVTILRRAKLPRLQRAKDPRCRGQHSSMSREYAAARSLIRPSFRPDSYFWGPIALSYRHPAQLVRSASALSIVTPFHNCGNGWAGPGLRNPPAGSSRHRSCSY